MSGLRAHQTIVRTTVLVVAFLYTVAASFVGVTSGPAYRVLLAALPTIAVLGLWWWDTRLWRFPIILRLHGRPNLYGGWEGYIEPSHQSGKQINQPAQIPCCVTVHQAFWSIHISLKTAESQSSSHFGGIVRLSESDSYELHYLYANNPAMSVRNRSPRHEGTATFSWQGKTPKSLEGYYYTDRMSGGKITLSRSSKA